MFRRGVLATPIRVMNHNRRTLLTWIRAPILSSFVRIVPARGVALLVPFPDELAEHVVRRGEQPGLATLLRSVALLDRPGGRSTASSLAAIMVAEAIT